VILDRVRELGELVRGRQFAVDQQVRDFEEIALLRELLDRDAAVEQYAFVAVDERDLALAGRRGHEPRIEREHPVVFRQARYVQYVRAQRATLHFGGRLLASGKIR